MGDHRANIKIEMEFHGIKDKADWWINYSNDGGGIDSRIQGFFQSVYERGMEAYKRTIAGQDKEEIEREERAELARLSAKYKDETVAQNCKHWKDGRCSVCGVAHQFEEVAATFHCPYFTERK